MRFTTSVLLFGAALSAYAGSFTPQAGIFFNAWALSGPSWFSNYNGFSQFGFPTVVGNDQSALGANAANASASFVTGTFSAYGGYAVNMYNTPIFLGEAGASLEDQVTFSGFTGTRQVVFGVAAAYGIAGNAEAVESVMDQLMVNGSTVAMQTVSTGNQYTGYSGSQTFGSWQGDLTYTMDVTPGTYTLEVLGQASVGPNLQVTNNLAEGAASLDPNWYLQVPTGVTYTTASGYQLPGEPLAAPEPSPFVALGLVTLVGLRRRKRD